MNTHQRGLLDGELRGDLIRRTKTNAANIASQPVWVFGGQPDRVGACKSSPPATF
jgi:hypothetical protein